MLALCWYPQQFFHLSFGIQDQTKHFLDKLDFDINKIVVTNPKTYTTLRSTIRAQLSHINALELLNYVPYRLLSPFFANELKGKKEKAKNNLIEQLSCERFNSDRPLYKITTIHGERFISIHPDWSEYLRLNFAIVEHWSDFALVLYLQKRNPNTPAIPSKVKPPLKRASLSKQQTLWQTALKNKPTHCIYSGEEFNAIDKSNYALDHFMPWSLVAHDQLWNLIPTSQSANSSKNNHIPHTDYVNKMIEQQYHLIQQTKLALTSKKWQAAMADHATDLRLSYDELTEEDALINALRSSLTSLGATGSQMGFGAGWVYKI